MEDGTYTIRAKSDPTSPAEIIKLYHLISRFLIFAILSMSTLAIVGWSSNRPILASVMPHYLPMKANTAISFILAVISFIFMTDFQQNKILNSIGKLIALSIFIVGLVFCYEYITNISLHIDQALFFEHPSRAIFAPGRPSPATAFGLICLGISLFSLNINSLHFSNLIFNLILLLSGLLMLVSLSFDSSTKGQIILLTSSSIYTSISFTFISIAIMIENQHSHLMSLMTSNTDGGITARFLFPFIILIPFLFSLIKLLGEKYNLHDPITGQAIYTVITIFILLLLTFHLSQKLMAMDTKRRLTERKLEQSQMRFQTVIEMAPIGMAIISQSGKLTDVNQAFCLITGCLIQDHSQQNIFSLFKDPKQYQPISNYLLQDPKPSLPEQFDIEYTRPDNKTIWLQIILSLLDNKPNSDIIIQLEDITLRKEYEDRIRELAFQDPLTMLPNRRLLMDRLDHAISVSARHNQSLAVLFLDLDNFKTVNDTLGHEAGDELIKAVAIRLRTSLREEDTVARLSGDEFVIILNTITHPEDAKLVATKLLSRISEVFLILNNEIKVGASIGIALYPKNGIEATQLLKQADSAMYAAKQAGKHQIYFA